MSLFHCHNCSHVSSLANEARQHCLTAGHLAECRSCEERHMGPMELEQHTHTVNENGPRNDEDEVSTGDTGSAARGLFEDSPLEIGTDGRTILSCVFCNRVFRFASAVAMHIESGVHDITRHQVTVAVHKLGIIPTISVDRRLEGPIEPPAVIITYTATEEAFDGRTYQCFFCFGRYATLRALNAHLNSPAHDADEFKCPKCKKQFKLVSGFIQHIESGFCAIAEMKEVQSHFENLTDQFSRALRF